MDISHLIENQTASRDIVSASSSKDARVLYHRQPKNMGLVAALNDGIALSSGEYIARMDADDISMPDRLSKQVAVLESNDVDLVGANYIKFPGPRSKTTRLPETPEAIAKTMQYTCCIGHPVATFSRKAFDASGGYDMRYAKGGAEDYDLWLRIMRNFNLANIKDPLLRYRLHNNS